MAARFHIRLALLVSAMCLCMHAPAYAQGSPADSVPVRPLNYENDTTFEFGIYNKHGERIASAYYRVLREETEGRTAYRFKYVGRNNNMSEASECWVYPDSLLPLRSTRKVVGPKETLYFDTAYDNDKIIFRKKREGGQIQEQEFPAAWDYFDYESLIWLIPQIEFEGMRSRQLRIFDTLNVLPLSVLVHDEGATTLTVGSHSYPAQRYSFTIGMVPYTLWSVNQNGLTIPARIDISETSFVNLQLDPKKVKDSAVAKPASKPAPKTEKEEVPEKPAEPGTNPLGPPPPGSRF